MSLSGVVGIFRVPRVPTGANGQMALGDHFRELRARLLRAMLALVACTVAAFFFYEQLQDLITGPYRRAVEILDDSVETEIFISGVGGALMIQLKLCALAGVILSSPVWLYQLWAFVVPGLHANEKKWTLLFVAIAGPLFGLGVATGYYVLPTAIRVLLALTPEGFQNLNDFNDFFSFITRMLIVFGIAFEIPFFVVLLNLAGVVSAKALASHRPWIILGTFVFAAVATPSTDPISMLMLAVPMIVLFFVAELIARFTDRRRARRTPSTDHWADDEVSPL